MNYFFFGHNTLFCVVVFPQSEGRVQVRFESKFFVVVVAAFFEM